MKSEALKRAQKRYAAKGAVKADELAEMAGGIYPLLFCRAIEIIKEGDKCGCGT